MDDIMEEDLNMDALLEEMSDLKASNEYLHESLNDLADRYTNLNWDILSGYDDKRGLSLDKLKELEETLSDMAETNPLMKRGAQLRNVYVFGKGMIRHNVKPGAEKIMDENPWNRRALWSPQGWEELNKAKFTAGNVFIIYDKSKRQFTRVPLAEVEAVETDPDSAERVQHILRRWDSNGTDKAMWYRVFPHDKVATRKTIRYNGKPIPVAHNAVMYHETANRQVGWTFGVPDSLAAMSWAIAYSQYLRNNATLVRAYSQFAYQVTLKQRRADKAAAKIVNGADIGGTVVSQHELSPMNATGSQVNFGNGQPLASMVATSLGVPDVAILSSPGSAGGSFGAAQSLDTPTVLGMKAIQDTWKIFYEDIYRSLGSKEAEIEFPAIDNDPVYRTIAALGGAYQTGAIHQEEYRAAVVALANLPKVIEGLPEPDKFNSGHIPGDEQQPKDPLSRQGNTGSFPGGQNQGETNNDGRTDRIGGER